MLVLILAKKSHNSSTPDPGPGPVALFQDRHPTTPQGADMELKKNLVDRLQRKRKTLKHTPLDSGDYPSQGVIG